MLWYQWSRLIIQNGILRYQMPARKGRPHSWPIVMPEKYRHSEFWARHVDPRGRHRGVKKTCAAMESYVYWPHLVRDVCMWIDACEECWQRRAVRYKTSGTSTEGSVSRKSAATQTDSPVDETLTHAEAGSADAWVPSMIIWNSAFLEEQPEAVFRYVASRLLQMRQQMSDMGVFNRE